MSIDYRALCEELIDALESNHQTWRIPVSPLIARARAALAEPESEVVGPTDEELLSIAAQAIEPYDKIRLGEYEAENNSAIEVYGSELIAFAHAVLARYGHQPAPPVEGEVASEARYLAKELRDQAYDMSPALELFGLVCRAADLLEQCHPAPVPVSERLPGPGDCDAEGFCWWFSPADPAAGTFGVAACWVLRKPEPEDDFRTHWLPATALPLPQGEVK